MKNNLEIYQVDENKNIITIYKNAYEVAKILKVNVDKIFIGLSNRTWKYLGYHWYYSNDYIKK